MTVEQKLLNSLTRYIQANDVHLPRDLFLRSVMDRIVDDLSAPITPQPKGSKS